MKIENPVLTWGSLKGWNGIHVIGDYYNATAGREDLKVSREGELTTKFGRKIPRLVLSIEERMFGMSLDR